MNTKTEIRFFTIADFLEEEDWLREKQRMGWRLTKMVPPCFYNFETCEPEDMIYRLDFKNRQQDADYMQMLEDFGWTYAGQCLGWLYFRKPASQVNEENEGELFSDNASRLEMLRHIMKTRLLPLLVIFLCCVIPNASRVASGGVSVFFTVFWSLMLVIYVYLLIHCGRKLKAMERELKE